MDSYYLNVMYSVLTLMSPVYFSCARGYYGDARIGGIGCRACMCPGGAGSGYQHGDTCSADFQGNVQCDCAPGYSGKLITALVPYSSRLTTQS